MIPDENVPNFIVHLILLVISSAIVVLTAPLTQASFPVHLEAWIVAELVVAALETLYALWATIIDSRDSTFYERKSETFLIVDLLLIVMNVATGVTGATYWRNGDDQRHKIFDAVVILAWVALLTLCFVTFQDKAKMASS